MCLCARTICAFAILVCVVVIVESAPAPVSTTTTERAKLLEYKNIRTDNGYEFKYETSDGQNREETGSIQKVEDNDVLVVRGFYSFIGDDGVEYTVTYVADQEGFRATGDHIPTTSTPKPTTDGDVQQFGLDCKILLSLCG